MREPESIYVTYIATTPQRLWDALTKPEFTTQYFFGRGMESDWWVGSPWRMLMEDGRVDSQGVVLESDPPRLLRISWHVEWMEEYRALPPAEATFRLEDLGGVVRLTVLEAVEESVDEKYREGGRHGWPIVLCGLKSLLETGSPLPPFNPGMALE